MALLNTLVYLLVAGFALTQAEPTVLEGQGLANYYKTFVAANQSECFAACQSVPFCAGASFKFDSASCFLVKYGLDSFNSTAFVSMIKPEFEEQSRANLTEHFALPDRVVTNVQFGIQSLGSVTTYLDSLTPLSCFEACAKSANCSGASFNTRSAMSYNCYLFTSTRVAKDLSGWLSYVKHNETLLNSVDFPPANFTQKENVTLVNGPLISKLIVGSSQACFVQCEAIEFCAGATFIQNESIAINCALFQYGFSEQPTTIRTVSYAKCRVSRDMENEIDAQHANDAANFPNDLVVRGVTFEHVMTSFRACSPTACFQNCTANPKCVSATFLLSEPVNCELSADTVVCDSPAHNRSIGFIKNFKLASTQLEDKTIEMTGGQVKVNVTLTDHFLRLFLNSSEACFKYCDSVPHCAGASYFSRDCFLHAYGFNETEHAGVTAYVKKLPADSAFFLNGEVKIGVQEARNSTCSMELLPNSCFERCGLLSECRSATFIQRIRSPKTPNCCFTLDHTHSTQIQNTLAINFVKSIL